jgi:hypothetical protein
MTPRCGRGGMSQSLLSEYEAGEKRENKGSMRIGVKDVGTN